MAAIWNFHGHSVRHLLKKIRSFDRDGDALKRISLLAIGYWLLLIKTVILKQSLVQAFLII